MNPEATREIYWNIGLPFGDLATLKIFIIVQSAIPLGILAYGLYRAFRRWRSVNEGALKFDRPGERIRRTLKYIFVQPRIFMRRFPFLVHISLFYGMVLLFIGTTIVAIQSDIATPIFNWYFFKGAFYLIFSLVLDLAGLVVVTVCLAGLYRRYAIKPEFLGGLKNWTGLLWIILIASITGFVVEGLRIAATDPEWGRWSPVGQAAAAALGGLFSEQAILTLHASSWWGHLAICEALIAMAGFAPLNHIFIVPLNVFFAPGEIPTGRIAPIEDMEEAEAFGVNRVDRFTPKQILDAMACVECGRCEQVCPAHATGKPLNPKYIVGGVLRAWLPVADAAVNWSKQNGNKEIPEDVLNGGPELIGEAIDVDAIWACTTCGACERECPALIPQIDKIVDMRRHLVLMEGRMSDEVQRTLTMIENEGNPWGVAAGSRGDWTKGLNVKVLDEGETTPLLYWVGCAGACDARAKKITRAMIDILNAAGVEYAVLGHAETCTGDPARRIGNEYLYQMLAQQNVETLGAHKIRKILTQCPHCLNTLAKEYPDFGGAYEVVHHTEFIRQLLDEGKIRLKPGAKEKLTFHDPCYLGRMNGKYEPPRGVLGALPGREYAEMERSAERSFCCGAGGGRMFMEETIGTQVNAERTREAVETGADTIAVACPFCMTMMSDGVKGHRKEEEVRVKDVAELVAEALEKAAPDAGQPSS